MINLIPTDHKESITYARLNTRMILWVIGIIGALLALLLIVGGSLFYLKQDTNQYVASTEKTNKILEEQNEQEIIARVGEMNGNLQLTLDVLSNEVLFSKLLTEIGNVMPPGTIMGSLSLNSELTGALDLTVSSRDYESGVQAQVNLTTGDSRIFQQADIGQVQCGNNESNPAYPCTSTIRALFAENNDSFLKLYEGESE